MRELYPLSGVAAEALASSNDGPARSFDGRAARQRHAAQQKLNDFEGQVRYVAQQAAALHAQQQLLRDDEHMDKSKLDAIFGMLNGALDFNAPQSASSEHETAKPQARFQSTTSHPSLIIPPPADHAQMRTLLPSSSLCASLERLGSSSTASGSAGAHVPCRLHDTEMAVAPPATRSNQHQQHVPGQQDDDALPLPLPPPRARHSRRRNHRQEQLNVLRNWFDAHKDDPYPTPEEKVYLARQVNMQIRQIEHCACHLSRLFHSTHLAVSDALRVYVRARFSGFTNRRKRHWTRPDDGELIAEDDDMEDA